MALDDAMRVLEVLDLGAAAGLAFVDPLGRTVADGLQVSLARADGKPPVLAMRAGPSGRFVAANAAGLWASSPGAAPGTPRDVIASVADRAGRFLPTRIALRLPLPATPPTTPAQLALPACLAGAAVRAVPLAWAPTLPVAAGLASLRLSLRELPAGPLPLSSAALAAAAPAAWAWLELRQGAALLATGAADARGDALLAFAYPAPPVAGAAGGSAFSHSWALTLGVRYQPRADAATDPPDAPPDYCALRAQPARVLVASALEDPLSHLPQIVDSPTLGLTLRYGQTLQASTAGQGALYVHPT
jgi:hypothetical protein